MEALPLLHLHSAGVYKALQNTMLTKQKIRAIPFKI